MLQRTAERGIPVCLRVFLMAGSEGGHPIGRTNAFAVPGGPARRAEV